MAHPVVNAGHRRYDPMYLLDQMFSRIGHRTIIIFFIEQEMFDNFIQQIVNRTCLEIQQAKEKLSHLKGYLDQQQINDATINVSPLLSMLTDIFYAIFYKLSSMTDQIRECYNAIALAVEQYIRICFNAIVDFPYPQQQF